MNKASVFILGAGGHAKVLMDCLISNDDCEVLGILDFNQNLYGEKIFNFPVIGNEDEVLKNYSPAEVQLINGIGSIDVSIKRKNIFNKFYNTGFHFFNVIHKTAYLGQNVSLGESVQIMARSTIQPGCRIGNNVIINTHAAVDHDCSIDDHVHLAPGVICCGDVSIGKGSHIGSGAVILQGVHIGENCLIAAGAVVTRDVANAVKVAGIPAKSMEKIKIDEKS